MVDWPFLGSVAISKEEYKEFTRLKAQEERQLKEAREKFRIKSVCSECGYQSLDHYKEGYCCPYCDYGGMYDFR